MVRRAYPPEPVAIPSGISRKRRKLCSSKVPRCIQALHDDVVGEVLVDQQDQLRADDVAIRRRISAGSGFKRTAFVSGGLDAKWAVERH
jgi:hypothetical protein